MRQNEFAKGFKDGIPIGLAYLAVSFSLGIACRTTGLTPWQGFLISLLNNASAGEYAGLTVIGAQAGLIEMAVMMLIVNARYALMSCALSQKLSPYMPLRYRFLIGHYVTDELFGIAVSRPVYVSLSYYIGAICIAAPCWCGGTVLGIIMGNMLPARVTSALCVALFGMFLAIIFPQAKRDKVVLGCIFVSFAASFAFAKLPVVSELSEGTRIIILTVVISAATAILFPRNQEEKS